MEKKNYTQNELTEYSKDAIIALFLSQQQVNLQQERQLQELNKKLDLLIEQIGISRQQRFGRSSEKIDLENQLALCFNEAEVTIVNKYVVEPVIEEVCPKPYKRRKQAGKREEDLKDIPVTVIEHTLSDEELKSTFGEKWRRLPDEVYKRLTFQPAKFEVEEHHVAVYCRKDNETIVKADRPVDLLRNSIVTPSLEAAILNSKYINAVPLYRLEQEFARNLERNQYTSSIVHTHQRCFRLMKEFFKKKRAPYSYELAIKWLASVTPSLCKSTFKNYRLAVSRVNAAYENQEIVNTKAVYESKQNYQHLPPWGRQLLDEFLEEMSSCYEASSLQSIKIAVARFLIYSTKHGISRPENISHHIVANYYNDDRHDSYKSKDIYNDCIRMFLRYLVALGMIRSSIPLMLDKFTLSRMVFVEELPKPEQVDFHQDDNQILFSAEEFYTRSSEVDLLVKQQRYSLVMIRTFHNTWKELFVFLEANELGYSTEIALAWAYYMKHYTIQWKTFRRAMKLFEQYLKTGSVQPKTVYTYQSDPADDLPKWCKTDYDLFMIHKKKEGLAVSTLRMYRSSCLRFLFYLIRTGIDSWDMVTPEVIKEFHYTDPHNTPQGKNAYASKIRGFLDYLSETGHVPFTLQLALSNESAPQVTIIKTLDDNELSDIYQYKEDSQTDMQLRDTAMVLLGLRMGFRASDIAKLKLSDISWTQQTISVQQGKTDKFLKLPMPTEVGNSLYRYIMTGRPETSSEYIFVAHRVPYDKLHRGVCLEALSHVLNKNSQGFHITRKTFASRMLQKDTKPEMIAEALGHSDNATVMKYLSTNGEKMRQCAIPLAEIAVKGGILA